MLGCSLIRGSFFFCEQLVVNGFSRTFYQESWGLEETVVSDSKRGYFGALGFGVVQSRLAKGVGREDRG